MIARLLSTCHSGSPCRSRAQRRRGGGSFAGAALRLASHWWQAQRITPPNPSLSHAFCSLSFVHTLPCACSAAPAQVVKPPSLKECMAGVMCECHRGAQALLAFPPPPMEKRRNRWVVRN